MSLPGPDPLPSILIIDDEATIRTSIKLFLEDYGYPVQEAANGLEGLQLFSENPPDIVLIDLTMPIMGGLKTLKQLNTISPTTPTIVISGTTKANNIVEALRCGAWDYLFKPLPKLSILLHSIEKVMERASLIETNKQYQQNLEITLKKQTRKLQKSEIRFSSLVANIPVGIFRYKHGKEGSYITANPAMAKIMGYDSVEALLSTNPDDLFARREDQENVLEELHKNGKVISSEILIKKQDGSETWAAFTAHQNSNKGKTYYIDALLEDISKRKEAEEKIQHLASFDKLTNLPNRSLFLFHLSKSLASSERKKLFGAVILLDLDRFKLINDSLGHRRGDLLIQEVAKRLQSIIRQEDTLSRIGGDEFAILFSGISNSLKTTGRLLGGITEKISNEIAKPFNIEEHKLYLTVTIGIDIFPDGPTNAEEILMHASTAANSSKKKELGNILFYMPEMQKVVNKRLIIEKELRSALQNSQLRLFYQPQVDSAGLIKGVEALIRWKHPKRGMISPNQFIPIAETNGLIAPIGTWVISEACKQLSLWQKNGLTEHLDHISVNVSPWQFHQPNFTETVQKILLETGVDPTKLTIELTESVVIDNLEETIKKMLELKQTGIQFSIDDFGTGYSSLSYLNKLPLDQLKIDRSFIQGLSKGSKFEPIVSTIIIMADNLGFDVVAEGVETKEELKYLVDNNCHTFQGFYFAKPQPKIEFKKSLMGQILIPRK